MLILYLILTGKQQTGGIDTFNLICIHLNPMKASLNRTLATPVVKFKQEQVLLLQFYIVFRASLEYEYTDK
jgi:hypothetical protein